MRIPHWWEDTNDITAINFFVFAFAGSCCTRQFVGDCYFITSLSSSHIYYSPPSVLRPHATQLRPRSALKYCPVMVHNTSTAPDPGNKEDDNEDFLAVEEGEMMEEGGEEEMSEEEEVGGLSCVGALVSGCGDETVLLRNDVSEFTPAELEELGRMEFADDDYYGNIQMNREVDAKGGDGSSDDNDSPQVGSHIHGTRSLVSSSGRVSAMHSALRPKTEAGGCAYKQCTLTQLLPARGRVGGTDAIVDAVLQQQQLQVADRGLRDTLPIECFLNLTHLYMQHNEVESLEGLVLLVQLRVLVAHHNAVTSLRPIAVLPALSFIDARSNKIEDVNPMEDLPCDSLKYLALLDNPCCSGDRSVDREQIMKACPKLAMLDDVPRDPSAEKVTDSEEEENSDEEDGCKRWHAVSETPTGCSKGVSSRIHLYRSLKMCEPLPVSVPSLEPIPVTSQDIDTNRVTTTTDRLCEQLRHRSSAIRRMAGHHALGQTEVSDPVWDFGNHVENDGDSEHHSNGRGRLDSPESTLSLTLPPELEQERATKARLYDDIRFALQADDRRLRQLAGVVWDDVDKVLSTRQALVGHRRHRMHTAHQQPSDAYAKSLEILKHENRVANLDKYRKQENANAPQ